MYLTIEKNKHIICNSSSTAVLSSKENKLRSLLSHKYWMWMLLSRKQMGLVPTTVCVVLPCLADVANQLPAAMLYVLAWKCNLLLHTHTGTQGWSQM